ncbi:MAG: tRNA glutamyl-Q(34) synthetase GluQRS [Muribaculaceae bacterium]|nr:tRNA glutamyl-Q(34) synthetase GluQRS [Muribaculaceae bacterium]
MPMKGRFAPSPSGRMHLGNVYTALLSRLSAYSQGGSWLLRIEDLDPQRSRYEHARMIEDDLDWLGLAWDEGGLDDRGDAGPYSQSRRSDIYEAFLERLTATGRTYPCRCTRAEIMATQAPHQSDGRVIYGGHCRPRRLGGNAVETESDSRKAAVRLCVTDEDICFVDGVKGPQSFNLTREVGDFILRRADGAWAYQLAVVVDDALMGVTEVLRGDDLLLSAAQQIYLYRLLGFEAPRFVHVPLVCNEEGRRLSKRDAPMGMSYLRQHHTAEEVLGMAAFRVGIIREEQPLSFSELLELVSTEQSADGLFRSSGAK